MEFQQTGKLCHQISFCVSLSYIYIYIYIYIVCVCACLCARVRVCNQSILSTFVFWQQNKYDSERPDYGFMLSINKCSYGQQCHTPYLFLCVLTV